MAELLVLGIESTAHTFSCSVVRKGRKGEILSNVNSVYRPEKGGIHPREAARHHTAVAPEVLKECLDAARVKIGELDAIAYSAGPGLGPCLRVGAVVARALAYRYEKPLVPVNHAIGHIELGRLLTGAKDPVVLLVSGGHTTIACFGSRRWRVFGETLDLTIGQLLDQFGRAAGFPSPSGPLIESLAKRSKRCIDLPYVVKGNDVSFSGLLTAAKKLLSKEPLEDVCYSLQEVAFSMLTEVTERALAFSEKGELMVVGGVAANERLRSMLEFVAEEQGAELKVVPKAYSGDCGAQIAWTGALEFEAGISVPVDEAFVRQDWRFDRVEVCWSS